MDLNAIQDFAPNRMSNLTANQMRAILVRRGEGQEPVALVLPKGAALIVAMFGVLKAGKIFMPLDPALPHARLSYLMEDAQAGLIVTNHDCIEVVRDLTQHRDCIDIDDTDAGLGAENPGLSLGPDMLACILYTSVQPDFPRALSKIIAT